MKQLAKTVLFLGMLQSTSPSFALTISVSERSYTAYEAYLISSFSYQSSATRAALSRQFDNKFSAQQKLIESKDAALWKAQGLLKRSKADASTARTQINTLEREITSLKTEFLKELAQKDAAFAADKAALEADASNFLKTPDGRKAMAIYLSSEPGAVKAGLLLFDQIVASRNEADKRSVAMVAYDSFQKGDLTTVEILKRFEGVAPPKARTHNDWYILAELYSRLVQRDNARMAAEKALETAGSEAERAGSFYLLGRILLEQENVDGALVEFEAAQKSSAQRIASDPQNLEFQRDYASILDSLGDIHLSRREQTKALSLYIESWEILKKLYKSKWRWPIVWGHLVANSIRIGGILEEQKDLDNASSYYRFALNLAEGLRTAYPQSVKYKDDASRAHQRIGDILRIKKDITGAMAEYQASHAIRLELYKADSEAYIPQDLLGQSFLRLGEAKAIQGNDMQALTDYQEAVKIIRKLSDEDPTSRDKLQSLEVAIGRVGNAVLKIGDRKGAIANYKEALAIARKLVKIDPTSLINQRGVMVNLGKLASEGDSESTWHSVLRQLETMQALNMLTDDDTEYMRSVRKSAANE